MRWNSRRISSSAPGAVRASSVCRSVRTFAVHTSPVATPSGAKRRMNEVLCFFSANFTPSSSRPKWSAIQSWNSSIRWSISVARSMSSGSCSAHSGNQNGRSVRRTNRSDSWETATPGRCRMSSWVSTRDTSCSTKLKLTCSSTDPCRLARMLPR
ncbi:hypothetical protein BJF83_00945 [Nocardiopsis sp. CNR-923]|nr:hypothetical protein BJF83_00945 [Nocardiopsis sp. CNR-923]